MIDYQRRHALVVERKVWLLDHEQRPRFLLLAEPLLMQCRRLQHFLAVPVLVQAYFEPLRVLRVHVLHNSPRPRRVGDDQAHALNSEFLPAVVRVHLEIRELHGLQVPHGHGAGGVHLTDGEGRDLIGLGRGAAESAESAHAAHLRHERLAVGLANGGARVGRRLPRLAPLLIAFF